MVIRAFGQRGPGRAHPRARAPGPGLPGLGRGGPRLRGGGPDAALRRLLPLARARDSPPEDADRANEKILDAVNLSGEAYLSHTKLGGRTVLRLAIGNVRTEERHVQKAWDQIRNAVGQVNK